MTDTVNQDRIYYETSDGTVVVLIPTGEMSLEDTAAKDVPEGCQYFIGDMSHLPEDRYFRNAWEYNHEQPCSVNIVKARDIKRDRLREIRAPLLSQLDVDYMKATESKNSDLQDQIAKKKQALRDVPQDPRIDAITDLNELKDFTPEAFSI